MIRTAIICETAAKHWNLLVNNIAKGDTAIFNAPTFPKGEQRGFGFHEAPRGTLSHWIVIDDGKIANYQAVVPSTWNAGPRDAKNQPGPYEAALVGNPVADPERPLEVLRTDGTRVSLGGQKQRTAIARALGCAPAWVGIATQEAGFGWREIS